MLWLLSQPAAHRCLPPLPAPIGGAEQRRRGIRRLPQRMQGQRRLLPLARGRPRQPPQLDPGRGGSREGGARKGDDRLNWIQILGEGGSGKGDAMPTKPVTWPPAPPAHSLCPCSLSLSLARTHALTTDMACLAPASPPRSTLPRALSWPTRWPSSATRMPTASRTVCPAWACWGSGPITRARLVGEGRGGKCVPVGGGRGASPL